MTGVRDQSNRLSLGQPVFKSCAVVWNLGQVPSFYIAPVYSAVWTSTFVHVYPPLYSHSTQLSDREWWDTFAQIMKQCKKNLKVKPLSRVCERLNTSWQYTSCTNKKCCYLYCLCRGRRNQRERSTLSGFVQSCLLHGWFSAPGHSFPVCWVKSERHRKSSYQQ